MTSFYTRTATATSDTPFRVDNDQSVRLSSVNIHCTTQDAQYGNAAIQDAVIAANAVVWFDKPVSVADFWFKNKTAGQNTTITITGTLE